MPLSVSVSGRPCPDLKFFRLNNYLIIIVFFFVFSNMQISLSILASTIFSSVRTATGTSPELSLCHCVIVC